MDDQQPHVIYFI